MLLSCAEEVDESVNIECEGFSYSSLQLSEPFYLDSIQYSNGQTNFLLSGEFSFDYLKRSFTIVIDADPRIGDFKVLSSEFPLSYLDKLPYETIVTYRNGLCEITWRRKKKRLYLRQTINEAY